METTTLYVSSAVIGILIIVIGLIVYFARQYFPILQARIEAEIGSQNWETITSMARTFILAAEQVAEQMGLDTGEKKKAFVVDKLVELAAWSNILVTREQIETLVEGVLKEIKRESTSIVLNEFHSEVLDTGA
ncbi:MAG: hypothetical protein H6659_18660 [Ardenticatenaceae bacterium]|nr:hypothetical protein [Anaerolineales bacterium]MCB8985857.1 hypothetical protein [Ardenticatenaceae bacterium]